MMNMIIIVREWTILICLHVIQLEAAGWRLPLDCSRPGFGARAAATRMPPRPDPELTGSDSLNISPWAAPPSRHAGRYSSCHNPQANQLLLVLS